MIYTLIPSNSAHADLKLTEQASNYHAPCQPNHLNHSMSHRQQIPSQSNTFIHLQTPTTSYKKQTTRFSTTPLITKQKKAFYLTKEPRNMHPTNSPVPLIITNQGTQSLKHEVTREQFPEAQKTSSESASGTKEHREAGKAAGKIKQTQRRRVSRKKLTRADG